MQYCDKQCKKDDQVKHHPICPYRVFLKSYMSKRTSARKGQVGLVNLGNTCYLNACLQCLSHMKPMTNYFLSKNYCEDLTYKKVSKSPSGRLAIEYIRFIREVWHGAFTTF